MVVTDISEILALYVLDLFSLVTKCSLFYRLWANLDSLWVESYRVAETVSYTVICAWFDLVNSEVADRVLCDINFATSGLNSSSN